jgi:hypothetical protein
MVKIQPAIASHGIPTVTVTVSNSVAGDFQVAKLNCEFPAPGAQPGASHWHHWCGHGASVTPVSLSLNLIPGHRRVTVVDKLKHTIPKH